jgi:hypothetical protein
VDNAITNKLSINGKLIRTEQVLSIEYFLIGKLDEIIWPEQVDHPSRRHQLWQQTCFELFVGIVGTSRYWEINISPNGCWNVYNFSSYRQNMRDEEQVYAIPTLAVYQEQRFSLSAKISIANFIPSEKILNLGIAVVLVTNSGNSYWAMKHLQKVPDFHDRNSFCLRVENR